MNPLKNFVLAVVASFCLSMSVTADAGPFADLTDYQLVQWMLEDFRIGYVDGAFCILPRNPDKFGQRGEDGQLLMQCFAREDQPDPPGWTPQNGRPNKRGA